MKNAEKIKLFKDKYSIKVSKPIGFEIESVMNAIRRLEESLEDKIEKLTVVEEELLKSQEEVKKMASEIKSLKIQMSMNMEMSSPIIENSKKKSSLKVVQ